VVFLNQASTFNKTASSLLGENSTTPIPSRLVGNSIPFSLRIKVFVLPNLD